MEAETTSIGRLRVRGGDADAARATLHAERLLGSASFRPRGLSPSAVLCVRSVRDPKPRALRLEATAVRPPPDWQDALRAVLEAAMRGAARPAHEAVPAGVGAVLFADRSELLACLTADWLARAEPRWWWAALVGELPAGAVVAREWAEQPRYVPAALGLLAQRRLAVPFAAELDAADAGAIVAAVASAFGLPWLHRTLDVLADGRAPESSTSQQRGVPAAPAPWTGAVTEVAGTGLQPVGELLVGVLLALRREPVAVRGPAFAEAVADWAEARVGRAMGQSELRPGPAREPRRSDRPERGADRTAASGARPRSTAGTRRALELTQERELAPPPPTHTGAAPGEPDPTRLGAARAEPGEYAAHPAGSLPSGGADAEAVAPDEAEGRHPGESVETDLGGLFFLVVLALRLGLTADFATPTRRALGLDPWRLIAGLGGRMLGSSDGADPAWSLLDRLAGEAADPRRAEALAPWLDVLARYATVRLGQSLGLHETGAVAGLVLRRHARVTVSPVDVNVVFRLAEHPIEIRLAGLDRDPGWLPAAGRHLRFIFQ